MSRCERSRHNDKRDLLVFTEVKEGGRVYRTLLARKQNEVRSKTRQRLLRKGGAHTRAEIAKLWEIQEGKCYYTGKPLGQDLKNSRHAKDHLIALARRGKNTIGNIVLCLPGLTKPSPT